MEHIKINLSNLDDAKTKLMLKIVLSRMNPEQKKLFLLNMQKLAYKVEIQKKLLKHKKAMHFLSLPFIPVTYLLTIMKVMMLKKIYTKQAIRLTKDLKRLKELASNASRNLISPERKPKNKEKQNIQR